MRAQPSSATPGVGIVRAGSHEAVSAPPPMETVIDTVYGVTSERMGKGEFYARLAALDEERLKKALWNLYWRGAAPLRERIEAETAVTPQVAKARSKAEAPDPQGVQHEADEFVALVKSGAYMAGDRRVHRTERSRWRITFRQHVADARAALAAPDPAPAEEALGQLIGLAVLLKDHDYVHSEDPVAAARIVVSDLVADLWASMLRRHGMPVFADHAMSQLFRWEQEYGWTRIGDGPVAEQEVSLASVVAKLLPTPDAWIACTDAYLEQLDRNAPTSAAPARRSGRGVAAGFTGNDPTEFERARRGDNLAAWHDLLLERLPDYDAADRLNRIAEHPALASNKSEIVAFRTRVLMLAGDDERARTLITAGLAELPGHAGFYQLAVDIGAEIPGNARRVMDGRRPRR